MSYKPKQQKRRFEWDHISHRETNDECRPVKRSSTHSLPGVSRTHCRRRSPSWSLPLDALQSLDMPRDCREVPSKVSIRRQDTEQTSLADEDERKPQTIPNIQRMAKIIGGPNRGQVGRILSYTERGRGRVYRVQIRDDHESQEVHVMQGNLDVFISDPEETDSTRSPLSEYSESSRDEIEDDLTPTTMPLKYHSCSSQVSYDGESSREEIEDELMPEEEKEEAAKKASIPPINMAARNPKVIFEERRLLGDHQTGNEGYRVPGYDQGCALLGNNLVMGETRVSPKGASRETCLFTHIFGTRTWELVQSLDENASKIQTSFEKDGSRFVLLSTKTAADQSSKGNPKMMNWRQKKIVKCLYAQVEGPGLESIDVAEELLKLGDFAALDPRKIKARMELGQSPIHVAKDWGGRGQHKTCLFELDQSDIGMIEESGQNGCGYISARRLDMLFNGDKKDAIQVRIFDPGMGIFKGMLVRKNMRREEPELQLPRSMLKVPASPYPQPNRKAVIIICQNGAYPSEKHKKIQKLLDPNEKNPSKDALDIKDLRQKSGMVLRLLAGVGVPNDLYEKYARESLKPEKLKHSWVVGVADPTLSLPPGHVYVPGLKGQPDSLTEVFVTRSPCFRREHGRRLPLVRKQPHGMSDEDWAYLESLQFGTIVFANPEKGRITIPEQIADGDNDGDLYFVCWNEEIISHCHCKPLSSALADEGSSVLSTVERREDWFDRFLELIVDVRLVAQMSQLTRQLYQMMIKTQDDSEDGIGDPDAISFAKAYTKTLEFEKHGGQIPLPLKLHEKIKKELRHLLLPQD